MSKIVFDLMYNNFNGYMNLDFKVNNNVICPTINNGTALVKIDLKLPMLIIIEASGKYQNDTLVDAHNNIINDKYVEITNVQIDHFKLNDNFLNFKIQVINNNKIINTGNYIGCNGTITINLEEENIMKQVIVCNNKIFEETQ